MWLRRRRRRAADAATDSAATDLPRPGTPPRALAATPPRSAPATSTPSASSSSARRTTSATTRPRTPGSEAVKSAFADLTVLQAENVPETAESEAVMQDMIDQGADLIFATSFGHLEFAENLAAENPEVVFVHQGGLESEPKLDNLGTYFGTVYEPVYTAGIAAGAGERDRHARLRLRLPDPADAGEHQRLHARRPVGEPRHRDDHRGDGQLVRSGPAGPGRAEPDRPGRRRHHPAPGLHEDDRRGHGGRRCHTRSATTPMPPSSLPNGWITGSEWDWAALYTDIVQTVIDGDLRRQRLTTATTGSDCRPATTRSSSRPSVRWSTPETHRPDRRRRGLVRRRRLAVHRPGRQPGRRRSSGPRARRRPTPTSRQMDFFVEGVVGSTG